MPTSTACLHLALLRQTLDLGYSLRALNDCWQGWHGTSCGVRDVSALLMAAVLVVWLLIGALWVIDSWGWIPFLIITGIVGGGVGLYYWSDRRPSPTRYAGPSSSRQRTAYASRKRWNGPYYKPYASWEEIARRDGYNCYLCGSPVDPQDKKVTRKKTRDRPAQVRTGPKYPSVDHVEPRARGGSHDQSNLRLAHKGCNASKHTRTLEEFRDHQDRKTAKESQRKPQTDQAAIERLIKAAARASSDGTFTFADVKAQLDRQSDVDVSESYIRTCLSALFNVGSVHMTKAVVRSIARGRYELVTPASPPPRSSNNDRLKGLQ